jgi:hypothetical protein
MANVIPNSFFKNIMNGSIDLDTDTLKVMILTSSHTPSADDDEFIDDVSSNEVSGTGYTAGGPTLSSAAVTEDDTNNKGVLDADDVSISSSSITGHYGIVYQDTGTASTSRIIAEVDFGEDKTSDAGTFTITWNASGIVTMQQSS